MERTRLNQNLERSRGSLVSRDAETLYRGGDISPSILLNNGSDSDSTVSISSTSSEDSLTKTMASSRIYDSDSDSEVWINNNNPERRHSTYSMPWKTQLQVSQSGRLKEKKYSRSQRNSTVIDNELFTPLDRNTCTKQNKAVRFAL